MMGSAIIPLTESTILPTNPVRSENNSSNTCLAKNDHSLMANPDVIVTLSSEIGSEASINEQFEDQSDYISKYIEQDSQPPSTTASKINTFLVVGGIAIGLMTAKMAMKCASQYLKLAPLQTERELAINRLANHDKQVEQEILREHPHLAEDPGDGSTLTDRVNRQILLNRMEHTSPY